MQTIIYSAIALVLLVIENLLRVHFPVWGTAPQLTFLLVIFFGFTGHPLRSLSFAFLLGFMGDSLTGNLPGLGAIIYVSVAYLMVGGRQYFFLRSIPFEVLSMAGMTALAIALKIGLLYFFNLDRGMASVFLKMLPGQIALNLGAGLILFSVLFRIEEATAPRKRENIFTSNAW